MSKKIELMLSPPWSNIYPKGEEVPVLLACLPSIPSNVWNKNTAIALKMKTH
jgi:hypothetical protein